MGTTPKEKLKLLSNNPEWLSEAEKELQKITQQAKKDVFETLVFDELAIKKNCIKIFHKYL